MPRRKVKDTWPEQWQHETPLERREHVARSYRDELEKVAPDVCAKLDEFFRQHGQGWVVPQLAIYKDEDLLTVELVADLEKVGPRTVDNWVGMGLRVTKTKDGNRFRYDDVLEFRANQRRHRIEQRRQRRAAAAASAVGGAPDVPSSA